MGNSSDSSSSQNNTTEKEIDLIKLIDVVIKRISYTFIVCIIVLAILFLIIISIVPNDKINIAFSFNDAFIGVIATLIGVMVTFVIGYQILNALEMKSKIDKMESDFNKQEKLNIELLNQSNDAKSLVLESLVNSYYDVALNTETENISKLLYYVKCFDLYCDKCRYNKSNDVLQDNFDDILINDIIECILNYFEIDVDISKKDIIEFNKIYSTYDDSAIISHVFKKDLDLMIDILLEKDVDKINVINEFKRKYQNENNN